MRKGLRGSGFRYTLRFVVPVSVIWFLLVVMTAPVIVGFMLLGGMVAEEMTGELVFFLATRMPVIIIAAGGLAVFTTARVAGPYVALMRAFEDVENGDLDRRLRLRPGDGYLREVETRFNAMMDGLQALHKGGRGASDP